jgi:site-specific DNA-adenine methylase
MTSYHGGKQRIGLEIAENIHLISTIIEDQGHFKIKGYCEPFCGMLGVYRHIPELFEDHRPRLKYKAGDINESVIKMWQAAQKGWKPPTQCSETKYNKLKYAPSSALRGYIGHQYSFGGQYFAGYAPKYGKTKDSSKASEAVCQIGKILKDVEFRYGSYVKFWNLQGYVIYCDPPYEDTVSRYYNKHSDETLGFNSEEFWEWCRLMSQNNIVFVSNYSAPDDTQMVMKSSHKMTGISPKAKKKVNKKRTEKLYLMFRNE